FGRVSASHRELVKHQVQKRIRAIRSMDIGASKYLGCCCSGEFSMNDLRSFALPSIYPMMDRLTKR
ncbi:MAG: hypothetical protein VX694_07180, partial [Planctomycetota bacterium]|nr:hypothetical protein [Planctomycetota bacterium]